LQIIQQQQRELVEAREHNVNGDSKTVQANPNDSSSSLESKGIHFNENGNGIPCESSTSVSSGTFNSAVPLISHFDASGRSEHGLGIAFVPPATSIHPFVPHPFVMHPQSPLHSIPSANQHISQSQFGHFLSIPAMPSNQQEEKNINYIPNLNQQDFSEGNEGTVQPSVYYGYNVSSNGNNNQADYSESSSSPAEISDSIVTESKDKAEVLQSHGVSQEIREISNDRSQNCSIEEHIPEENNGVPVTFIFCSLAKFDIFFNLK